MTYNSNDFVIDSLTDRNEAIAKAIIIAENKSLIAISEVSVRFNTINENGGIENKLVQSTRNILPGEKIKILNERMLYHKLRVTDITIKASDGTVFQITPPIPFLRYTKNINSHSNSQPTDAMSNFKEPVIKPPEISLPFKIVDLKPSSEDLYIFVKNISQNKAYLKSIDVKEYNKDQTIRKGRFDFFLELNPGEITKSHSNCYGVSHLEVSFFDCSNPYGLSPNVKYPVNGPIIRRQSFFGIFRWVLEEK